MSEPPEDTSRSTQPTIYTVAERAGVSIATVSFAFSKPGRVAPATRERILQAARELHYVPRGAARDLALGRTGVLGFWTYDYTEFSHSTAAAHGLSRCWDWPLFIDEVERGFTRRAWARGYSILVLGNGLGDEEERVRDLASRVDAIAVMPNSMATKIRETIATYRPVVAIAEVEAERRQEWQVGTDNREGMSRLTHHLLEVHGYRDLRFIGSGSVDYDVRFEGFSDALRAAGATPPASPEGGFGAVWHAHETLDAFRQSIARGVPDAFVCASDLHAAYAVAAATAAGLAVPGDLAVTGFDNLQAAEAIEPALTTVNHPMQQMGATAADLLIDAVEQPSGGPVVQIENSELVVRRSCGCAPPV